MSENYGDGGEVGSREYYQQRAQRAEAKLEKYIQAVYLASTCAPDMPVNISDPVDMMNKVCVEVTKLRDCNMGLVEDHKYLQAEINLREHQLHAITVRLNREQLENLELRSFVERVAHLEPGYNDEAWRMIEQWKKEEEQCG